MDNQLLQYESGQNSFPMSELDNSGDNKTFQSQADQFSGATGFAPVVMPNGMLTGGQISVGTGSNKVKVTASTANLAGVKIVVPASELTVTRASGGTCITASVTINAAGVYEIVAGLSGPARSDIRGAAGGPAFIPVDSIEVGQIELNSTAAAPVKDTEIKQSPGLNREVATSPVYSVDSSNGTVSFVSDLKLIHVGGKPKKVFASYAEPIFADVDLASDYQPSEESFSVSSSQHYGGTVGTTSKSLNGASFKAFLNDGISDPLIKLRGQKIWFRFYPDRYTMNYILEQGILGCSRKFPPGAKVEADFTISPEKSSINVEV
ncbi:hypothetical protein J2Y86_000924 [Pseudomonas migulae]|uniref:hypothetical protein n=1 Tax=Pseudomonas migulae TaxID=78543 RepID=UPI00209E3224|nr:hypothetical protein [Pseudomonas migulae]MCP1496217.1 hypothetical protein [Pseudomonas migulae]